MLYELTHLDAIHDASSAPAHLLLQVQRGRPRLKRLLHPVLASEAVRELVNVAGYVRLDQGADQELPLDQLRVIPVAGCLRVLSCSFRCD